MQKWHAEKQKMSPMAEPLPDPKRDSYAVSEGAPLITPVGSRRPSAEFERRSSQQSTTSDHMPRSGVGSFIMALDNVSRRASDEAPPTPPRARLNVGLLPRQRHMSMIVPPTLPDPDVGTAAGLRGRSESLTRISESEEGEAGLRLSRRSNPRTSVAPSRSSLSRFDRRRFRSFSTQSNANPPSPTALTNKAGEDKGKHGWWKRKVRCARIEPGCRICMSSRALMPWQIFEKRVAPASMSRKFRFSFDQDKPHRRTALYIPPTPEDSYGSRACVPSIMMCMCRFDMSRRGSLVSRHNSINSTSPVPVSATMATAIIDQALDFAQHRRHSKMAVEPAKPRHRRSSSLTEFIDTAVRAVSRCCCG